MIQIAIFSTKYIDDGDCLFSGDHKVLFSNKDVYKHLLAFFSLNKNPIDNAIKCIKGDEHKLSAIRDGIKRKRPDYSPLFEDLFGGLKDDSTGESIKALWNILKEIFTEDELGEIIGETEETKRVKKRAANFFQLEGQNIFAIQCLESGEKSKSDSEWIPTLINCAKEIAKPEKDQIELLLVLHDKDLSYFTDKDYYIISEKSKKDELEKLVGITDNIQCKIVFFQHTVNKFAKILKKPFDTNRNIFDEIVSAIYSYEALEPIKKAYKDALASKGLVLEKCKVQDSLLRKVIDDIERNDIISINDDK